MNEQEHHKYIISINPDRCQGHSRCCMLAPKLFDSDDLGYAHVRGEGIVPSELVDKAKLAVANCPEFAIIIKKV
jgi:ferredoxin